MLEVLRDPNLKVIGDLQLRNHLVTYSTVSGTFESMIFQLSPSEKRLVVWNVLNHPFFRKISGGATNIWPQPFWAVQFVGR